MSRYRFIAIDRVLPEIDLSGFTKMKVRELKNMNPIPRSPISLDHLDDDTDVLFAVSEEDIGGLQIALYPNPPYEVKDYIKKKYIYSIHGYGSKCIHQLQEYLQTNIQAMDRVEVWSIWLGDKVSRIYRKRIQPSDIMSFDFEILNQSNCCITIREPYIRQPK